EAGMPLYGNELDRSTNAYEAGLGRVVKLDKGVDFVGRAALEKVAADGPARRLVGLIVRGRGIARHGHTVWAGDRRTGAVTSGTHSPTLGAPIAMAYVAPGDGEPGTILEVEIRDQRVAAEVVALPFYRRPR
ncbi:MAG TPA: glycine cleavage T C-terminal barrel domain-containing protein, partial [Candidatus Limnocylindrales bacterium]